MGWARSVTFLGAAVIIATLLVGGISAQEHTQSDPGVDLLTTGYLGDVQTPTHDMRVAWEFEPPTEMAPVQPLVLEAGERDLVLVATSNERNGTDRILALNASDGGLAWDTETEPVVGWTPSHGGNLVYASVEGEGLVALSVQSGEPRWTAPLDPTSPPVVGDQTVYVAEGDRLVSVEFRGGEIRWDTRVEGGTVTQRPSVANGTVFVAAEDLEAEEGAIQALDSSRGEVLWSSGVEGIDERDRLWSPVPANDLLYISGYGEQTLAALDPVDGRELWKVVMRGPITSAPTVSDCTLIISQEPRYLLELNATTGEERSEAKIYRGFGQRPTAAGGTLYLHGMEGDLVVLEVETFLLASHVRTGSPAVTPPTPSEGHLLLASQDRLKAIEGDAGPPGGPDVYDSCPDAGETARERAEQLGANTTRSPETPSRLHDPQRGDLQPSQSSPDDSAVLQNVSGGPMPASAEDGSGDDSRTIPSLGLVQVALVLGGLAAARRPR